VARAMANGIEIEYETSGSKTDPAVLLIMGLGAQLTIWPDALCEGLASKGFFVIRFDNRDTGLTTDFGAWGVPNIAEAIGKVMMGKKVDAPYLVKDMAGDGIGLLDVLGIDKAHIVGASMGGMIAQTVAALWPERTRSLVSIYSTSGRPGLPAGKPEALAMLTAQPEGPSREQRIKHGMNLRTVIGSPGYLSDEAALRAFVEKNVDRRWYPEGGARQYLSIIASGDRVDLLKTIKAPTLVLHGEEDPLLPVDCGRDVARLIPGAEIQTYPGWGHDFPSQLIPTLVERIAGFCKGK
jgi:pimeloyl-ACP methyl ester carboxylesterase